MPIGEVNIDRLVLINPCKLYGNVNSQPANRLSWNAE